MITRRKVLQSAFAGLSGALVHRHALATESGYDAVLTAVPQSVQMVPEQYGPTPVWCFNGSVPGPEIRVRQGQMVRVLLENNLEEDTTVHWHGVRLPNHMDGVPHLTQPPVAPGEQFLYEFGVADAGTFWYHPHMRSAEQVGRGLYGALIVEEADPPLVDRDLTWVLDDWRLGRDAGIIDDFGHFHDLSHGGRIGNTVTLNGTIPDGLQVRRGERIRLRLINCANARVFQLNFEGHSPRVIAIDGQPVPPHDPPGGKVVIGPAMRIDLMLDMTAEPGSRHRILDTFYLRDSYQFSGLFYSDEVLREEPLGASITLQPNPIPEPVLNDAREVDIRFEGGAMGRMQGAVFKGEWQDIRTLARNGAMWSVNGIAASGHVLEPMLTLKRNQTCILHMTNDTAWPHPIHLHGHSFRVLSRNGIEAPGKPWQDTVLMDAGERVDIAFVADNPGDWMFHCHILEHQMSGMMGVIRVVDLV